MSDVFQGLSPTDSERQHEEHRQRPDPRGTNTHQRQSAYAGPKALRQRNELDSGAAGTFPALACPPHGIDASHRHQWACDIPPRENVLEGLYYDMLSCLTLVEKLRSELR